VMCITDDPLRELFGEPIYSYTDDQAVKDGVLVPFITDGGDTGHRITRNAYEELTQHYRAKGHAHYEESQFYRFFFHELLPLVPLALREYEEGRILTTDFDFRVRKYSPGESHQLWYLPNERNGVTMMKPEDY
jgi:hypothetical protein